MMDLVGQGRDVLQNGVKTVLDAMSAQGGILSGKEVIRTVV